MQSKTYSLVLSSSLLLCALGLAGCSGLTGSSFPDVPAKTSVGTLQGSVFGGHAPIVGAQVYLLEAQTNGYAAKAKSLLSASYSSTVSNSSGQPYSTTLDNSGDATNGLYHETTDSSGAFNIAGDYTCDVGDPVYLYTAAGSPNTGTPITIAASSYTEVTSGILLAFTYAYTFTFTANNLLYPGQTVTLSSLTGTNNNLLNGAQTIVSATPTSFTISYTTTGNSLLADPPAFDSATGTGTPVGSQNPAIVNLAMLGNCPSTGTFQNSIRYIYMNEVSTAAVAYALGGFGTDGLHIGSSSTNLIGLQNAAINAGQLYDIQGSNQSTTYDGEGHIARANTPAGNGIVTQTVLDEVGNILASCVDSANTYNPVTKMGTASINCNTLAANATSDGTTTGTTPIDTATAAFNIAHYPAGVGNTNFVTSLYSLPTGVVPFTPTLTTQPNDFTVAIQYPVSLNTAVSHAESIGIDSNGNIWMNSYGNKNIFEMSPVGVVKFQSTPASYSYGYLSVDPSNNIWSGGNFTQTYETEWNNSGTVLSGAGYGPGFYDGYMTVTDGSGNAYISGTSGSASTQWQEYKLNSSGGSVTGSPFNISAGIPAGYDVAHGAIENASTGGDIWWTTEAGAAGNVYSVARVNPTTGALAAGFPVTTKISAPEMPGIDSLSNLWVANQQGGTFDNTVVKITTAGTVTTATGGTLTYPFGTAIDGAGNVWVTNRGSIGSSGITSSVVEYNGSTSAAISPASNYTLQGDLLGALNVAVDPSGVLWVTSFDDSMVVEMLGSAAPTTTPLSYAASVNKLGTRP
jgi:hypothetical protein